MQFEWDENKNATNQGVVRIISARRATRYEKEKYERYYEATFPYGLGPPEGDDG
jgi:uncharacterized DUF497 family protein